MRQGQFGARERIQLPTNERKALSSIIWDAGLDRQRRWAIYNTVGITYRITRWEFGRRTYMKREE